MMAPRTPNKQLGDHRGDLRDLMLDTHQYWSQTDCMEWSPLVAYAWGSSSVIAAWAGCGETFGRCILNIAEEPLTLASLCSSFQASVSFAHLDAASIIAILL